MTEESPPNGRTVGVEYGIAGKAQLDEKKAERAADLVAHNTHYPSGATEPVPN